MTSALQTHLPQHRPNAVFQIGYVVHPAVEAQVLVGRQVTVEQSLMGDQPHVSPYVNKLLGQIKAVYQYRTACGLAQSGQDANESSLAGSIRANQGQELAIGHLQVYALENGLVPKGLDQPSDLYHRLPYPLSSTSSTAPLGCRLSRG